MQLRLLGRVELEVNDASVSLPRSRKTRALLGYLAATREAHLRSWLCSLLWEGPADPRAQLRWSLAKLRPLIDEPGRPRIVAEGDAVRFDANGGFLDVARLKELVPASPQDAPTGALREAASLFRGAFLDGIELDGCFRFDAWLTSRREEYRRLRSAVLAELLKRLAGDPDAALPLALDRLAAEPYSERGYLDVAELLTAQGRDDEALTHLERARLMLEEMFEVQPSAELRALQGRLERSARRGGIRDVDARDSPDPLAAARRAVRAGHSEQARRLVECALEAAAALPPERRADRRLAALEVFVRPAMASHRPDGLERRLSEAVEAARRVGRSDLARFGFYLLANLHYQHGNPEGALRETLRAEGSGRLADPLTVVRALGDTARCLGMLERHPDRAERLCEEALALSAALAEPVPALDMAFGLLRRHQGRYDEALEHLGGALEVIRENEDDWWEATCLLWLPMLHLERGRPTDALVACGELRAVIWRRDQAPDAAFARGLEETARSELEGSSPGSGLDEPVSALRETASRWMLAYLQVRASACERRAGRRERAARRAEEALELARTVGRQNEVVLARAALASLALEGGAPLEARLHLDSVARDDVRLDWLSARASDALDAVRVELGA
ncbi:MAG TPA: BTAD domain-containing putative transcriptional regulator [Longimicrobiales bacterium]|nr:BTAD domain-containing putative transcriptional regulator [Longimicrobiales bacterium]